MTNVVPGVDEAIPRGPIGKTALFFRQYWHRGGPGTPTPDWVVRFCYRTWLVALLFKVLGSSWDMSWHFQWLRDDLAPPHLLNSVGTGIVIVLVAVHTFTGMACDARSLRLMQGGLVMFLIAAPLDSINHAINGLDITTWSGSHFLLFLGTALMILGAIQGWRKCAPAGRGRALVLGALWAYFLENALFPNGQQEYGTLALQSWLRGEPRAEPILLQFAAAQLGRPVVDRETVEYFALPIADWVYPVWGIGAALLVLAAARVTMRGRWSATAVVGVYLAYRCVTWVIFYLTGFPYSIVPFWLIFVGLGIDLAFFLGRSRAVTALAGAALATGLGYVGLWLQSLVTEMPPEAYWSAPITFAAAAALWLAARLWFSRASAPRT